MDPSQAAEIEAALPGLLEAFYARVRADTQLGPVFNDAVGDWDHHLATLADFWSSVMLTTGRYKGDPMGAHMRHRDLIPSGLFPRWLALWNETTAEMVSPPVAAGRRRLPGEGRPHRPEPGPGPQFPPAQG